MQYKISIKGKMKLLEIYLFFPLAFFMENKILQAGLEKKKICGKAVVKILSYSKDKTLKER